MSFSDRTKAIEKRRKELERTAEKENPGMRAEVAEMFTGKSYVLFLYTYLKDVRLVFAPPQSIGNFGGEVDNWEWPRHTGDFSFMRAYVAPDGSSAEYSPNNIPFTPKRFVQVNPKGVDENDLVFLLGYPGRTIRHKTFSFLKYEQEIRLPMIVESYASQIATMEQQGAKDRGVAIKHASRMKSLANVEKRSRGQLLGLSKSDILAKKKKEEEQMQAFIESDPDRKTKYGKILSEIDAVYDEMKRATPFEIQLRELRTACRILHFAFTLYDASVERLKEDLDREVPYMDRNFDQTTKQLLLDVQDFDLATDRILLQAALQSLRKHSDAKSVAALHPWLEGGSLLEQRIDSLFSQTKLAQPDFVKACLSKSPEELAKLNDSAIDFIVKLYPLYVAQRESDKQRDGKLNPLYGLLVDVKQSFLSASFIPDANSTLRMTFGHVRGYSPRDALYKAPITTLKGVIEKTTEVDPFLSPKPLLDLYAKGERSPWEHPRLHQIPVAILYDADTTGGNSGSPVFNAAGELIGVNFDRTFEATINDFAWNKDYSRSIGVDIRYVLWVTGSVYKGTHLLQEMGVSAPSPVK